MMTLPGAARACGAEAADDSISVRGSSGERVGEANRSVCHSGDMCGSDHATIEHVSACLRRREPGIASKMHVRLGASISQVDAPRAPNFETVDQIVGHSARVGSPLYIPFFQEFERSF